MPTGQSSRTRPSTLKSKPSDILADQRLRGQEYRDHGAEGHARCAHAGIQAAGNALLLLQQGEGRGGVRADIALGAGAQLGKASLIGLPGAGDSLLAVVRQVAVAVQDRLGRLTGPG